MMDNLKINKKIALLVCLIAGLLFSCKSTDSTVQKSAEESYRIAMENFNDEDWEDAQKMFDIIKLQYPASIYADDAQYHLAEINFSKKEFIMAAYNYNLLRRVYPQSEFYKISLFKVGICYYELSPPFDRDQEYTTKAIQSFTEFQSLFPKDSLSATATEKIKELRDKLAEREYSNAMIYRKMYSPRSSIIYYDIIIDDYPDTKFYEQAFYDKIEVLYELLSYDEAVTLSDLYKRNFPNGKFLDKIKNIENSITKNK